MFCQNCGNQMNETDLFCANCGWKNDELEGTMAAPPVSAAPTVSQVTMPGNQYSNGVSSVVRMSKMDYLELAELKELKDKIDKNLKFSYVFGGIGCAMV